MCFSSFLKAQTNTEPLCGLESEIPVNLVNTYSYSTNMDPLTECEPYVLNVKFWGINKTNGVNYWPERERNTLKAIADLNILYNPFGIIFKYKGYEEFNSPYVESSPSHDYVIFNSTLEYHDMVNWADANGYKDPNAFNVYLFGWGSGIGGITNFLSDTMAVMSVYVGNGTLLNHEMGHALNLAHTRSSNEHATRDVNSPNFNATTHGDHVVDTNANSGYRDAPTNSYPFIDSNCNYFGTETDNVGDQYSISHLDVINVLTDAYLCVEAYLTPGQGIRARETIAAGNFDDLLTDVASLYEPYTGEYYFAGPVSPNNPPLFQPGFDYRFISCGSNYNVPSDYDDISFTIGREVSSFSKYETNFEIMTHPNHTAIEIDLPLCDGVQKIRKCYDNYNRAPIGGRIIRFNDGVFNTNITQTAQDSLQINDQNLINNLQLGLYKVEKNYDDGATQETVIIKDNN